MTSLCEIQWESRAVTIRVQYPVEFVTSVFVCSSVLLDYMKSQQEKTDAMMREFQHLKLNVEKVVKMCEYTNTS